MKVNVKALIESLGYVKTAIPYFIDHEGLRAYDGLAMHDQIGLIQKKLEGFKSEFDSMLDFHNSELETYMAEIRSRTDKAIGFEEETIPKTKAVDYVLENNYDEVREAVFEQEMEAQKE